MKKAARVNINLLPKDPFFSTRFGQILRWALSAGRYIVIFTEVIVIMSFIARFTLDRQVTDLNGSIERKKQVILSFGNLEDNVRTVQEKIDQYRQAEQETNIVETFENLTSVVPNGIILSELAIRPTAVTISGNTFSRNAFNLLVNNLQLSPSFNNINVVQVQSSDNEQGSLDFSIQADTRIVERVRATNTPVEEVDLLDRTQGL